MKREFDPEVLELMDRPQSVSPELEKDLENLRRLNRYFGSYRLVRRFLHRWINPGDEFRILDIATGSGDIPRMIVRHARRVGATVAIDALDQQEATIQIARDLSVQYPEISFRAADVLEWEPDTAYDIVHCSLALHHFSEPAAVEVLRRAREWSRRYVVISDLSRGLPGTIGVYFLTTLFFREPMTRYDARLSMARAFSFREMAALAGKAGWTNFSHARFRFSRQAIWLE